MTQIIDQALLAKNLILRESIVWIGPKFDCMIQ